jgi:hypothetical protein
MKSGALTSIKFMKLKRGLKLPQWQAVGLLESLWQVACGNAPQGDIGKLSNEDIAASIEWDECPDELIEQLTHCGWLEKSDEHRLIIHDWHDHAPNYIRGGLAKAKKQFLTLNDEEIEAKVQARVQAKVQAKVEPKHIATKPNLTKPSQTQPQEVVDLSSKHSEFSQLQDCEPLSKITIERYITIKHAFPKVNAQQAVFLACLKAGDPDSEIKKPDGFLRSQFQYAPDADPRDIPYAFGGKKIRRELDGSENKEDRAAFRKAVL